MTIELQVQGVPPTNEIVSAVAALKAVRMPLPKEQFLPGDEQLDLGEAELGLPFPQDYRYFLKTASDTVFSNIDCLRVTPDRSSRDELTHAAAEAWQWGVPRDWLPFAEDNGDYFCLTRSGEVRFWDHNGPSTERWPNLAAWIQEVWIGGA